MMIELMTFGLTLFVPMSNAFIQIVLIWRSFGILHQKLSVFEIWNFVEVA